MEKGKEGVRRVLGLSGFFLALNGFVGISVDKKVYDVELVRAIKGAQDRIEKALELLDGSGNEKVTIKILLEEAHGTLRESMEDQEYKDPEDLSGDIPGDL